ncbi:serine/threonine protein kinase, CMGC, CDC2/CDK sub [Kluyveromyces marxianus]|nr:serine/threonine protein kinase, CMGC, CDC2/CDK sub [Kluyveromyces marxianus]
MSTADRKPTSLKYRIGKVKQIPTVVKDEKSGLESIQIPSRENEPVYGVTNFLNNYREEEKLGQGTFGEITILKRMNHKNIVKLIEIVYDESPTPKTDTNGPHPVGNYNNNNTNPPKLITGKHFFMILPYMVSDLTGLLHNPRVQFDMGDVKNIMLQLFEGINYIHCNKFLHRDIKTANILIDHKGVVKIADFGLARNYFGSPPNLKFPGGAGSGAKYTSVVVTRWYRAPEIVLGDRYYTTAVDIWGIGCVFAEFFEKKPILQGQTDIDQGHVIFKLMGTPSMEEWALAYHLPGSELTKTNYKRTLNDRFSRHLNETGLDLLSKLLALDPYKRITAMMAKRHPFFTEEPLPSSMIKLPNEESHESDIKRYKNELNEAMTQRPPSAPAGHNSTDNSIRSVSGTVFPKEGTTPKVIRADLPKPSIPVQPGPSRYNASVTVPPTVPVPVPSRSVPKQPAGITLPKGPKNGAPSGPHRLPPNPRGTFPSKYPVESRFGPNTRITTESYNAGKRYQSSEYKPHSSSNTNNSYGIKRRYNRTSDADTAQDPNEQNTRANQSHTDASNSEDVKPKDVADYY